MAKLMTLAEIKTALRNGMWAGGGYPMYFIAADGMDMSFQAIRDNWKLVVRDTMDRNYQGWALAGVQINWENKDLVCGDTGEPIPCAYPSDEEADEPALPELENA